MRPSAEKAPQIASQRAGAPWPGRGDLACTFANRSPKLTFADCRLRARPCLPALPKPASSCVGPVLCPASARAAFPTRVCRGPGWVARSSTLTRISTSKIANKAFAWRGEGLRARVERDLLDSLIWSFVFHRSGPATPPNHFRYIGCTPLDTRVLPPRTTSLHTRQPRPAGGPGPGPPCPRGCAPAPFRRFSALASPRATHAGPRAARQPARAAKFRRCRTRTAARRER